MGKEGGRLGIGWGWVGFIAMSGHSWCVAAAMADAAATRLERGKLAADQAQPRNTPEKWSRNMWLKIFNQYLTELMCAEVYFPAGGDSGRCVFNHFRSQKQYIYSWMQLSQALLNEMGHDSLLTQQQQYVSLMLQYAGKVFICQGSEVVSHKNLLIYSGNVVITEGELGMSARRILLVFLKLQYAAWENLCQLCTLVLSVYRGSYQWLGNGIDLLELGDALWVSDRVKPLTAEKTKKMYFKMLFGFFNLPIPADPCHRLGEISRRSLPDSFLSWLRDQYYTYRSNLDM